MCHRHSQEGPETGVEISAANFDRDLWNNRPRSSGIWSCTCWTETEGWWKPRAPADHSICEPLTAQPISLCLEKFEHLNELSLADHSNGRDSLQIDVLIGADYYWELVTGRTSRCEDGPVAVHTRLGWVLSGPAPKTKQSKSSTSLLTTHTLHVGAAVNETETLDRCTLSGSSCL